MITEIKEIANLGGTVVVVLLFLYYLTKKEKDMNKIISNHLEHSGRIIEKNSEVMTKVSVNLKELSIAIKNGKVKAG